VFNWLKNWLYLVTLGAFVSTSVFFAGAAYAEFTVRPYVTYHGYTGEEVTVEFDFNGDAVFEAQIVNNDLNERINVTPVPSSERSITFTLPRSGHYSVWIRAIKNGTPGPWARSYTYTDAQFYGKARGWWLYGAVAPTGGIEIN